MGRRKMGEGSTLGVLFRRDPIGSPAGGGCCGLVALGILGGLAGVTVGLVYATHAAMGFL